MTRLAVLILTCNEEKNIADCIKSASFADEIVVIDSGSTDATESIAVALGAHFCCHAMQEDGFAGQRNFALAQTEADWVFYLDADERLTDEAGREIRAMADKNESAAYKIKRLNLVLGQCMRYGAHLPDWSLRLYPRQAVHWRGVVHESAELSIPVRCLQEPMQHYTYKDWETYFRKFNQYTTLAAQNMKKKGARAGFAGILLHPLFGFFKAYVLRQGWRDGLLGFIMSVLAGFSTFVKYIKLRYL